GVNLKLFVSLWRCHRCGDLTYLVKGWRYCLSGCVALACLALGLPAKSEAQDLIRISPLYASTSPAQSQAGADTGQGEIASEAAAEGPPEADSPSPLSAATWCVVKQRPTEPAAPAASADEGGEPTATPAPEKRDLGCDLGMGVALYRWHRLSLVGVIGTRSIGAGFGFIVAEPKNGPLI